MFSRNRYTDLTATMWMLVILLYKKERRKITHRQKFITSRMQMYGVTLLQNEIFLCLNPHKSRLYINSTNVINVITHLIL